ncbi:MAG: aldehyde:ferredoxin oxidoreductase, partial [Coriobacteriia bacterium]|nr:aldehyde:ferredoxin oxidoreductase [Coriobacteriia bacterium]
MATATGGYMGKILILDLTAKTSRTIDSGPYQKYHGGHGLGQALFFENCTDFTCGPLDPANVLVFSASPFSGTPVPSSSGRMEIVGFGARTAPYHWFQRSSMGGRVPNAMKNCGYDAMVITGAADSPVWVNIVNDHVDFVDATDLWGKWTDETQEIIWERLNSGATDGEWFSLDRTRDGGRSTQKPAVMCIGPASEKLGAMGTITHDANHHAGQSGFGAVWGSKNLKALSFLGTHSIPIADPNALLNLRIQFQNDHAYRVDDPILETPQPDTVPLYAIITRQPGFNSLTWNTRNMIARPSGCQSCVRNCRRNFDTGIANESMCAASLFYSTADTLDIQLRAHDLMNRLGINGFESALLSYLRNLYKMGVLGPGCAIDSQLPWDHFGSWDFVEAFLMSIANRTDIGADLADGSVVAIQKWGRWEEDSASGLAAWPQWGYVQHYDPRLEVEWGFGSVLGERDINEHGLNWHVYWMPLITASAGQAPLLTAEELANVLADSTGLGDPMCFNYSEDGIYSDAKLKCVAWHRHYSRFWLQTMLMCDWVWPNLVEYGPANGDPHGATHDFEPQVYKAATGLDITYEESIEAGHKIYTFDRAIWCLQGRKPEDEVFSEYVYNVPT